MATDKSLVALLRALQDPSSDQDTSSLLGSAATLLTLLSNPLNVTLLTAQLLSAPAVWSRPNGLQTTVRVFGIFKSTSNQILQRKASSFNSKFSMLRSPLSEEDWIMSVVKGADNRSPQWRHLLVLGGLLLGLKEGTVPEALRRTLENATVKALNFTLEGLKSGPELAINSVVIVLSHVFTHLSDYGKKDINYDSLLPHLYWAPFSSSEGLYFGYFLSTIDVDIVQGPNGKFDWSRNSSTYRALQHTASSPLLTSLGSLSRLIANCIQHVTNSDLLANVVSDITAFTRSLSIQWRQNKLSEIDVNEEKTYLSDQSLQDSLPLLWQILKSSMFSIIVILRSLLSRVVADVVILRNGAPFIAIQTLQILRDLNFISCRSGASTLSQFKFVYAAAIDILSQYPIQAEKFLVEVRPVEGGRIPQHPLDRCLDLFFLNTAEHFALVLSPEANENLLLEAAMPYLGVGDDRRLIEIFEAAHSVVLAVFSAPQNSDIVSKCIHHYIHSLFEVFPQNLSPRQFRMALKTLIRMTASPSTTSTNQPLLPIIILELVLMRLETSSPEPLPYNNSLPEPSSTVNGGDPLSERAVMVLTLIDALPYLPIDELEEWLPIIAELTNKMDPPTMRQLCTERFWEVLSSGEMDVDRSALCVSWWTTKGGRHVLLRGTERGGLTSSSDQPETTSKL